MSAAVSDAVLKELRNLFGRSGSDPDRSSAVVSALDELLQRREYGSTPDEFVERMAARTKDVEPTHTANFLENLAKVADGVRRIRQIEAQYMKERGARG